LNLFYFFLQNRHNFWVNDRFGHEWFSPLMLYFANNNIFMYFCGIDETLLPYFFTQAEKNKYTVIKN